MKKYVSILTLFLIVLSTGANTADNDADALLGTWLSEKKDARFQLYKTGNKYYGKIIWGTGGDTKDSQNPEPKLRSRELIGLVILNDFVYTGNKVWEEGSIYDPREGKTYSCKLTMKDPNILEVRGFIGVSIFGRTEKWTRVK